MEQVDWNSCMSFSEPASSTHPHFPLLLPYFPEFKSRTWNMLLQCIFQIDWHFQKEKAQNKSCHWGYTLSKSTNMYHIGINLYTIGIAFKVLICTF